MEDAIMLTDKVAIVTGAARGIGKAIALKIGQRGGSVAVVDLHETNANDAVAELQHQETRAIAIKTDVTNKSEVDDMVGKVLGTFGKIDILVNDVGWWNTTAFINTTEELWDKIIAINYSSVLNCSRAVLDYMIERQSGKIVSIGSEVARVGGVGDAVYSGAKAGVIAFSKSLAREVARYNINVNVVCPGTVETETYGPFGGMVAERPQTPEALQAREKLLETLIKMIPFRRRGKPMEIAEAVAFLASPAADYITGQVLSVSGGVTMVG